MYKNFSAQELAAERATLQKQYDDFKAKGLRLDMSRGKPSAQQLDLSNDMLRVDLGSFKGEDGVDCRNYGILDGIKEVKRIFSELLGVDEKELIIGGNSSLNMMYDSITRAMLLGVYGGKKPWGKYEKVKFLCPAPGYDRHFAICQSLGIEMITIPCTNEGPDMDEVERLVSQDEEIKGIWCVPKYSNPMGTTYSDETVRRLASMKTRADDFRIFWDNAYCVHHLTDTPDELLDLLSESKKNKTQHRVYMFTSTSKISFPGSGVAAMAASEENINFIKSQMTYQTIGYDKLNMLRHALYFKNADGIKEQMKKHSALIAPKFDIVCDMLDEQIKPLEIASWHRPNGGYFISFTGLDNTAKRTVELCKEAGVVLTGAGATYPYGKDPHDSNIRIAPTFPTASELKAAMEIFCVSARLAAIEALTK